MLKVRFNGNVMNTACGPTTRLINVLTSACHHFHVSSLEYGLFYRTKEVDLSQPLRLSGVIANSEVELKRLSSSVTERSGKLCLKFMSGERREGVFLLAGTTLWEVLLTLEKV
jgi:hypothetical protein